ncbi:hydrolase [Lithospermum erythrorhizon]|uniref:soluble epoxide hydrolase n=1 Tax=Lithospermum erythrorhizon TaxID=34254 RepID=A0AAV3PSS4_LITER
MEKIEHRNLKVNGINMHVAEIGEGPVILFLHGFPELWYSWRHQMLYLSSKGFRAIAPDLKGYGDTDVSPSMSSYTYLHIVGDIIALIDALEVEKVLLVGHDWGAIIAWNFCLFRPDRVKALVNLSVPFMPRLPSVSVLQGLRAAFGDDYYICRFQEPGEVEGVFASAGTGNVIRKFLCSHDPTPPIFSKEKLLDSLLQAPAELPSWLTEEDVNYYATKFDKTGFTGGLNYYRAMHMSWELTAPWTGSKVLVPTLFIVGDQDLTINFPSTKEYMTGGGFKKDVPNLQEVIVLEGVGHFINQEKPDEVNNHICEFFNKF